MSDSEKYPDISDLIARKAKGRMEIKRLSFGEKIELMEALRRRLAPFKALREARQEARGRLGTPHETHSLHAAPESADVHIPVTGEAMEGGMAERIIKGLVVLAIVLGFAYIVTRPSQQTSNDVATSQPQAPVANSASSPEPCSKETPQLLGARFEKVVAGDLLQGEISSPPTAGFAINNVTAPVTLGSPSQGVVVCQTTVNTNQGVYTGMWNPVSKGEDPFVVFSPGAGLPPTIASSQPATVSPTPPSTETVAEPDPSAIYGNWGGKWAASDTQGCKAPDFNFFIYGPESFGSYIYEGEYYDKAHLPPNYWTVKASYAVRNGVIFVTVHGVKGDDLLEAYKIVSQTAMETMKIVKSDGTPYDPQKDTVPPDVASVTTTESGDRNGDLIKCGSEAADALAQVTQKTATVDLEHAD